MDTLIQDIRHAVRQLARNRGFTALAVLALALGVGANTAVFSMANWLVLRPVPGVPDQSRLAIAQLWYTDQQPPSALQVAAGVPRISQLSLSYPQLTHFTERMKSTAEVAGLGSSGRSVILRLGDAEPTPMDARFVAGNYFEVLGVPLEVGRTFTREEEFFASTAPLAVISHSLWASAFGQSPDVATRSLEINGVTVPILGVAARGFRGDLRNQKVDMWLPPLAYLAVEHFTTIRAVTDNTNTLVNEVALRLLPGVTMAEARARVEQILPETMRENPRSDSGPEVAYSGRLLEGFGTTTSPFFRENLSRSLRILLGVSSLLLLIACANLANLVILRTSRRREEVAVRRALGAEWGQLVRQQLTEAVVLALLSCVAAVVVALACMALLKGPFLFGIEVPPDIGLDWRVLGFAVVASVIIAVLATVIPMAGHSRPDLIEGLKQGAQRTTARRAGLRGALAVAQMGISLTLLIGALLLVSTLRNLHQVDVGFDPRGLTGFNFNARRLGFSDTAIAGIIQRVRTRLRETPGIEQVSQVQYAPFDRVSFSEAVQRAGVAGGTPVRISRNSISFEYFDVLKIPFVLGRGFTQAEVEAAAKVDPRTRGETPAVINELLATQLFGGQNPVGEAIDVVGRGGAVTGFSYRVVGVAKNTRWTGLAEDVTPFLYRPTGGQMTSLGPTFIVRSTMAQPDLEATIRKTLRAESASLLPGVMSSFPEKLERGIVERRAFSKILVTLASLALLLATIGLYGLIASSVTERTREFGIRLALGAEAGRVARTVLRHGAILALIGIPIGLAGAVALSKLVQNRLFGVDPVEPLLYATAAVLMIVVALVACYLPARNASRVDPLIALRSE